MTTAEIIRTILMIDIVAMSLFAILYLKQRRMSWSAYLLWGLLALGLPVLGPFLVISNRPGDWDPDLELSSDVRRLAALVRGWMASRPFRFRLSRPAGIYHATTRLERARQRRQSRRQPK